jgi:TPR repeat protein
MNDAKEALGMLENLAGYDLPQAKTMYGLALLMQDKPWYDTKKGLLWLKKGADEADGNEHDASFSMFQYGLVLVDGQMGVPADPVTGKYWIDKAAAAGYKPAVKEQKKRWNR